MEEMRKSTYMNYDLATLKQVTVKDRNAMFTNIKKGKNTEGGNWGGKEQQHFYGVLTNDEKRGNAAQRRHHSMCDPIIIRGQ